MLSFTSSGAPPSTALGAARFAHNFNPSLPFAHKKRLHLPYLDGIRALMALYVMHQHLLIYLGAHHPRFQMRLSEIIQALLQGHYAVVVFIVLSGYCLMLPVLRDGGTLRGELKTFFLRRARRILPPYYAALAVANIALMTMSVVKQQAPGELASPESWILHLLLLHNLSPDSIYEFSGTLWSIATEWQIYFLFPFLFLPVWKRFGEEALLVVAGGVSLVATLLFPSIAKACPWFIALFALGMVAAKMSLELPTWGKRVPWAWTGCLLSIATYLLVRIVPAFDWQQVYVLKGQFGWYPLSDMGFGLATLCFLMHGTRATLEERRSKFVSVLTWRPLVFIGAFSYSLYLIHTPIQAVVGHLLIPHALPRLVAYGLMLGLYVPLTIALSYGFYLLAEKPFVGAPKPKATRTETALA